MYGASALLWNQDNVHKNQPAQHTVTHAPVPAAPAAARRQRVMVLPERRRAGAKAQQAGAAAAAAERRAGGGGLLLRLDLRGVDLWGLGGVGSRG